MAAKASRIHTLLLLIALSVASLTVTVAVTPVLASSSGNPTTNGDPDRPNDCPKPTITQQSASTSITSTSRRDEPGRSGAAHDWSWAMNFIATLLGRHGL